MNQKEILLHVSHPSWRSWRAKRLLRRMGYHFELLDTTAAAGLQQFGGHTATPYIFVDSRPVGNFGEFKALAHSGEFDRLVRGDV